MEKGREAGDNKHTQATIHTNTQTHTNKGRRRLLTRPSDVSEAQLATEHNTGSQLGKGGGGGGREGRGKCGHTTANTTVWLMYKNECSFGYTITAFAALASIIPLGRKSEKFPEGMRRSGVANTVIVYPNEQPRRQPDLALYQLALLSF